MANELTENQRQRLYALWDQAQTDLKKSKIGPAGFCLLGVRLCNYSCSQLCQTFCTSSSSSMISIIFSISLTCSSLSSF